MPGNRDVLLGTIFKSQYKRVIKPGDYLPYFIDIYNIAFVCSQKSVAAQFLLQLFQRRANFKNALLRENYLESCLCKFLKRMIDARIRSWVYGLRI